MTLEEWLEVKCSLYNHAVGMTTLTSENDSWRENEEDIYIGDVWAVDVLDDGIAITSCYSK